MAAPTEWVTVFTDEVTLAAASVQIKTLLAPTDVRESRPEGWTVRRVIGRLWVRQTAPTNDVGWFFNAFHVGDIDLDSADLLVADYVGPESAGHLQLEAIPHIGLAGDSTALANIRPLSILALDFKQMRRIGRGQTLFASFYNEHNASVSYGYHYKILLSETPR